MTVPDPGREDTRLAGLRPPSLHVHAGDVPSGQGESLISRDTGGVEVRPEHGKDDAALRGPAAGLLLVLTRRLSPTQAGAEVLGDPAVSIAGSARPRSRALTSNATGRGGWPWRSRLLGTTDGLSSVRAQCPSR